MLDLVIEFLPRHAEAREDAEWIVNRLVENNARSLPEDFLAYHQSTLSPYHGMRGPVVVETDEYPSAEVTLPPKTSPGEMLGILILGRRQRWHGSDIRPSRLSSSCVRRR